MSNKNLFFIAIIPPEPYCQQALALKHHFSSHYQSKASLNSPPHITLHMPFEWGLEKEHALEEKLRVFAAQHSRFSLEFNHFGAFAPRVIFVDVKRSEQLHDFQKALIRFCRRELNLFNANYRDLPFHPHLTLAFRDLKKPMFAQAWDEYKDKKFEGEFTVQTIALLKHDGKMWNMWREFELNA